MARDRDDIDEDEEEEREMVLFQGALNGEDANLAANARLVRAGLIPSKNLVTNALNRRAEMIVMDPKGQATLVRFVVDGVAYPGAKLSRQQGLAVTQMMKLLSGLDIQQRRIPQSGGVRAELAETKYELRVESTPIAEGAERLTIRAKNLKKDIETPAGAGLSDDMRAKIRELSHTGSGAILVCGPPHSGTTTTNYAVLRSIDAYMQSIFSIAHMGGRDIIHVTPFEVDPNHSWNETIERLVRVEAHVLFMDPIHNAETARNVLDAQKRLVIVAEFTAKDAAHGIVQLCQWAGDPKLVADGLRGIVSQKLVRLLCEHCRAAFRPNPKLLQRIGLPPETKTLYRATTAPPPRQRQDDDDEEEEEYIPCAKCNGIGFLGRTGLFELIEMTEQMRQLVVANPDVTEIKKLARSEGMTTLQGSGLDLVAKGKTSLEELQRVFKSS
jgi:type II secretory ATPase GspE/PulE/Tfp pilus assembly ATPase PilB-like protein